MTKFGRGIELPKGDFFKTLPKSEARSTIINWLQQIKNIKDQYQQYATVREGVQKDAIQNAWDARSNKDGRNWRIRFQLHTKDNPKWLSFTDSGTCGLTGRVLKPQELELDLPPNERWGRFENLAFTKGPSEGSLGARGQGKFIFVAASESLRILYDSLRPNDSYRFGVRWVEITDSKVMHWDNGEARKKIIEYSPVLKPLTTVGTRVIIDEPNAVLINSIVSGEFARFIAITWWDIITRFNVCIEIDAGDGRGFLRVETPQDFVLPAKDTAQHLVSLKENISFSLGGKRYGIEKIHIVSTKDKKVREDIRGIALQRGGMRIMRLEMKHVPPDITNSVYGFVRFDRELDEAMKALEDPTHFNLNLHRGVGRKVREIVEKALDDFARERLGADGAMPSSGVNNDAAKRALSEMNRIAKMFGVQLRGSGTVGGAPSSGTTILPVRISFVGGIEFPRKGSPRVNYGESLKSKQVVLVNDTENIVKVRATLSFIQAETDQREILFEKDCSVNGCDKIDLLTPFDLTITRNKFARGRWGLVQKVVALEAIKHGEQTWEKGLIIQEFTHRFWVEEDPPEFGVFEEVNLVEFLSPEDVLQYRVGPGSTAQRRRLDININHPAYKEVISEAELVEEYVFEQAAIALVEVDLDQEKSVLVPDKDRLTPALLLRTATTQLAKILAKYYGG